MENIKIGNYLKKKRKEKGKTQAEIASEMGVTYQAVSRWENGDSIPDIETLANLAGYYQITVDDILQIESINTEVGLTKEQIKKHNDKTFIILMVGSLVGLSLFATFGILGYKILIVVTIISLLAFGLSTSYLRRL